MLMAPAFNTIEGVTLFPDDTLWYRFYPIAPHPTVRRDDEGDPVFLLVKYAFSDEERLTDPSLPSGGGYLNFDVEFSVPADTLERVRAELQTWVDGEWQRLRDGTAEEQRRPGVAGTTAPPPVEFGTPTWTGGAVSMDAPQSAALVAARVAEGAPSLLAGNVAVFSMDLTPSGASFMEETLVGSSGGEGSDLTPIQVGYDLSFWARLPPVRIHVRAESKAIYEQVRKVMDGSGRHFCTTYDFEHSDITTDTAEMTGLIEVKIDEGSGSLDSEVMAELRRYSLEIVQGLIESSFFTTDPSLAMMPDGAPLDLPPDTGTDPNNTKRYLKKSFDSTTMTLEFNVEQSSVVEWRIHPQATLATFFEGMSAEELRRYVRVVDLDDDFFKHLGLEVRVFAPFDDPAVGAVEVEVLYEGRDENGERRQKTETFTFTDSAMQSWSPSLIGDGREYRFRYRVQFTGRGFGPHSEWQTSRARDLNIAVATPGRVSVDLIAGDVDFAELVERVQIDLAYEDVVAGVERQEHTVVLDAGRREARYERLIFDFVRQPIQYRRRFTLASGEVIEDDLWQTTRRRQLVVNQPFEDILSVRLLPAGGGWSEIAQVIVDLRYRDPSNRFEAEESVSLKSNAEFRTWNVVLRDKNVRDVEYKVTRSFQDGRLEQTDWQRSAGEETIPIVVEAPPRLQVKLVADRLDFAAAPLTEVALTFEHAGGVAQETFVFRDKSVQTWTVEVPANTPLRYRYAVTHFPSGGDPVTLPPVEENDAVVVLPPYRRPEGGTLEVQVMAQLVDFAQTPLVVVDLAYEDEEHDVRAIDSLTFDSKTTAVWSIEVADVNRRLFSYKVTHFLADGSSREGKTVFQEAPRIILQNLPVGQES